MIQLNDIVGNMHAKRAVEVALAGNHNILFIGAWTSDAKPLADWAIEHNLPARSVAPCPCGYFGDPQRECTCSPFQVHEWRRLKFYPQEEWDITVEVYIPDADEIVPWLLQKRRGEPDKEVQKRVKQAANYFDCDLDDGCVVLLKAAIRQLQLAPCQIRSIISVARTIANLAGLERITTVHLAEAIQYRPRRD